MTVGRRRLGRLGGAQGAARLSPAMRALLLGEPIEGLAAEFAAFLAARDLLMCDPTSPTAALWAAHGGRLTEQWVEAHPGTRPAAWWAFTAPRLPVGTWPGWFFDGRVPVPRRQIGGTGRPAHEVSAHGPASELGVWTMWYETDPAAPPVVESEASYLRRHDLLLPGEERRLPPDAFDPERVPVPPVVDADAGRDDGDGEREGGGGDA